MKITYKSENFNEKSCEYIQVADTIIKNVKGNGKIDIKSMKAFYRFLRLFKKVYPIGTECRLVGSNDNLAIITL